MREPGNGQHGKNRTAMRQVEYEHKTGKLGKTRGMGNDAAETNDRRRVDQRRNRTLF